MPTTHSHEADRSFEDDLYLHSAADFINHWQESWIDPQASPSAMLEKIVRDLSPGQQVSLAGALHTLRSDMYDYDEDARHLVTFMRVDFDSLRLDGEGNIVGGIGTADDIMNYVSDTFSADIDTLEHALYRGAIFGRGPTRVLNELALSTLELAQDEGLPYVNIPFRKAAGSAAEQLRQRDMLNEFYGKMTEIVSMEPPELGGMAKIVREVVDTYNDEDLLPFVRMIEEHFATEYDDGYRDMVFDEVTNREKVWKEGDSIYAILGNRRTVADFITRSFHDTDWTDARALDDYKEWWFKERGVRIDWDEHFEDLEEEFRQVRDRFEILAAN